jgi:hypothetical protein
MMVYTMELIRQILSGDFLYLFHKIRQTTKIRWTYKVHRILCSKNKKITL